MAIPSNGMTRRRFLAASAGVTLLGACGGSSSNGTRASGSGAAPTGGDDLPDFTLIEFFPSEALRPGSPQRLPLSIADQDGAPLEALPTELSFTVTGDGRGGTEETVTVQSRSTGLPRAYFPLVFTPPAAGIYDVTTTFNGNRLAAKVQVPATSAVPAPGEPMVSVDTPTLADPRGTELVCSADPPCPLHTVTLGQALAGGGPVALLISTPRFCQQAICGPVLDLLLAQQANFPSVTMLHSEVYVSVAAAQGQPAMGGSDPTQGLHEAVRRYQLGYEPVLFLAMPGGTISDRLDVIYDETELRGGLSRLLG